MWVGADLHPQVLRTLFLAPNPSKSEEEALLRCVPVDALPFLAGLVVGDHVLKRRQSNARSTIIGGVLSERQPSIQLHVIDHGEPGILVGDATDALLEFLSVFRLPPVVEVALRIEVAGLVSETVRQFMADHQSDAAEIYGIVYLRIEKRRLQNARREDDLVVVGTVVGIHFRWRHAPFAA